MTSYLYPCSYKQGFKPQNSFVPENCCLLTAEGTCRIMGQDLKSFSVEELGIYKDCCGDKCNRLATCGAMAMAKYILSGTLEKIKAELKRRPSHD